MTAAPGRAAIRRASPTPPDESAESNGRSGDGGERVRRRLWHRERDWIESIRMLPPPGGSTTSEFCQDVLVTGTGGVIIGGARAGAGLAGPGAAAPRGA